MMGCVTWTPLLALLLGMSWEENNKGRETWGENSIANLSNIMASGNNLSNCWICHPHPQRGAPKLQFVPTNEDVPLTLTSGPVRSIPLLVGELEDRQDMACVTLTDTWNQTGLQVKRPLLCREQGRPCCPCETSTCLPRAGSSPPIFPMSFSTASSSCVPNRTHWCVDASLLPPGDQPNFSCTFWKGTAAPSWRLAYQTPSAFSSHAGIEEDAELGGGPMDGGPLSPRCKSTPTWGPLLRSWFNSPAARRACAPRGHLFFCGPPQNKLPCEGSPGSSFSRPLRAVAYSCVDNVHFRGECTVGRVRPEGLAAAIQNLTSQARRKRALGLILAGTPLRDGVSFQEAALESLTQVMENAASSSGDPSEGLQEPPDSRDDRLALDYLLATRGGVCVVVNDTCCTYINASGEVELNTQEVSRQAGSLRGFKSPSAQTVGLSGHLPSVA
ncbi:butyrophilin subfamily 1 member A1 isoform X2 [Suricata suricatta]|uniref:butyrophilin subfamily 1 member A1 isoform X2 n=1 Tax=Suricata suricatta TaxID=37032 RepID=UPI0011554EC3|nr:butyrophilin subfamily 1 member A1 isoform X2 [Suricata suricatta]XP_029800491.1 butyrophilin subfamily 1 member A1 isoform X2 [Suricata suricatta]XP_029800493.1 butyrophilin subfamily 1 member A1 isoform X2 [Suricata suricatta]XP_029800494.1 butyrophilin subfamily 1 member A1 isoform X2 [Suricata suricatta]